MTVAQKKNAGEGKGLPNANLIAVIFFKQVTGARFGLYFLFNRFGLYLFSHGQLYVAFSRSASREVVKILTKLVILLGNLIQEILAMLYATRC